LFGTLSRLSNHYLQQLAPAIAQLSYSHFRRFIRIQSIEPKPEPLRIIVKFDEFNFMGFAGYIIF
jgi:hypothetical protein